MAWNNQIKEYVSASWLSKSQWSLYPGLKGPIQRRMWIFHSLQFQAASCWLGPLSSRHILGQWSS